jgi:hypothetical protein
MAWDGRYKFNVLVTTWEVVMGDERDGGNLARIPWDCVIVDEVLIPRTRRNDGGAADDQPNLPCLARREKE